MLRNDCRAASCRSRSIAARLTSSRVVDAKSRDSAGEIVRSRSLKASSITRLPADRAGGGALSGIASGGTWYSTYGNQERK